MEAKLTGEHPADQTDRGLDLEAEIGKRKIHCGSIWDCC
jgi:hypothetical protein